MAQNPPPMRPPVLPDVTWRDVVQQETVDRGPDGKLTSGYKVMFTTAGGVQGWVFVPRSMYSVNSVRAAIAVHARELDAVQNLST